jgi:hypothetical protein
MSIDNTAYTGKQMILVCDNATYHHHKRVLESFGSKKKDKLVKLAIEHGYTRFVLPLTNERHQKLMGTENIDNVFVLNDGENCEVAFDPIKFAGCATSSDPFILTSEELKKGLLHYITKHCGHLLECQIEKVLSEHVHDILWTPVYTPELQPIAVFGLLVRIMSRKNHH